MICTGDDRDFKRLVAASAARAIFCTQSNDFALGLPVIQALYGGDEGRRRWQLAPPAANDEAGDDDWMAMRRGGGDGGHDASGIYEIWRSHMYCRYYGLCYVCRRPFKRCEC